MRESFDRWIYLFTLDIFFSLTGFAIGKGGLILFIGSRRVGFWLRNFVAGVSRLIEIYVGVEVLSVLGKICFLVLAIGVKAY